jgi:hypothetical protein
MSRARRQQKKRARRWALEVRDTVYGWRASWWFKGREMHPAYHFPKVERRFRRETIWTETGRLTYKPELQRLSPRTAFGRALARTFRVGQPAVAVDYSQIEARIAARL